MNERNNISDKEINELLKWRLLKQDEDESLTQKLTDMEAKLVFGDEALVVPSLQKENEMIRQLTHKNSGRIKWWIGISGILITSAIVYMLMNGEGQTEISVPERSATANGNSENDALEVLTITDSLDHAKVMIAQTVLDPERVKDVDTLEQTAMEKWQLGDALKVPEYRPRKEEPEEMIFIRDVPVLSPEQKDDTKKRKNKMIKAILKKDKYSWAYIPMSTDVIDGETVSVAGFYMQTGEVTNQQYKTFLNDLLMQGKAEEYFKALPDTNRWITEGRTALRVDIGNAREWAKKHGDLADTVKWKETGFPVYEPMRKNYFWHPAYDHYPVVTISRDAAKMYCDWLTMAVNEKIKKDAGEVKAEALYINDIRIPAETEWTMAARGGKGNVDYPWSSAEIKSIQNKNGCYLANFCVADYKEEKACPNKKFPNAYTSAGQVSQDYFCVAPTMSYNGNPYGLFNLSGNVAEMVWKDKTRMASTKGGSWNSDVEHIKLNAKDEYEGTTHGSPFIGFRPVFTARSK